MTFLVSKIFGLLIRPSMVVLLLVLAGAALSWTRWPRLGRWVTTVGALVFLVFAVAPLGNLITLPLEERFARPDGAELARVDGIVVLGGVFSTIVNAHRGTEDVNEAADRLTEGLALAKRFPAARLVFAGGSPEILYDHASAGNLARRLFERLGVDMTRVTIEGKSRNTYENALFAKRLVAPGPDERWLLVTSAFHMPRAVGCFRRVGFEVVPWPSDFRTGGPDDAWRWFGTPSEGLRRMDTAVHEWIGLAAYYVLGRTSALYPAPRS